MTQTTNLTINPSAAVLSQIDPHGHAQRAWADACRHDGISPAATQAYFTPGNHRATAYQDELSRGGRRVRAA